jgi:hypothetical protein
VGEEIHSCREIHKEEHIESGNRQFLYGRNTVSESNFIRLYMDKGFCEVPVINYLKKRGTNAIIALPLKGKTVKSYLKGRKSRIVSYTMKSQKTKATATFDLAIACKYSKKSITKGERSILPML